MQSIINALRNVIIIPTSLRLDYNPIIVQIKHATEGEGFEVISLSLARGVSTSFYAHF